MKRTLKRKPSLGFVFVLTFILMITKKLVQVDWAKSKNYSNLEEELPSTENPVFAPKSNSIYFHDTSHIGGLTPRQACSVESAARVHPRQDVYVLFSSPVAEDTLKASCLAKLREFPNVKFLRINISEYSKGTAVQSILNNLKGSIFRMQYAADMLKILTLYKWGGICVETDMIMIKSLQNLPPNWIVQQYDTYVATGIMSFAANEVGRNITKAILEEIKKTYKPNESYSTGEIPIRRAIQRICPKRIHWDTCVDIGILPYEKFFPIRNILWSREFKIATYQPNYSFRIWNALSDIMYNYDEHYMYQNNEALAKKYCPSIYLLYRDELNL
ncbi:lactosylceramide 4-alpha-galactosyltransferase-like [Helicoverpa zea]|uniref:lactosylceramide 4-alpha-galactosyltransferase-like n=1 Tax=Helicoverpa zea TaxID=7113 RepID=UPI001F59F3E6|nr:lactosylceramide 4-alpha-galactosyltransferase-like [Helicoverpa zea]